MHLWLGKGTTGGAKRMVSFQMQGEEVRCRDGQPEESAGHDDSGASGDQERGYLCLLGRLSAFINFTGRASETLRL